MKLCFVPSDFDAPGCYRCMFPARALKDLGHDVLLPPFKEHQREKGVGIEFRLNLSPPKPWAEIWVLQQRKERMWVEGGVGSLRRWGVASVAEVDDNYLELPTYNPAFEGTHPYRRDDGHIVSRRERRMLGRKGFKLPPNKYNREHMHNAFRMMDAMTVSTPYLANVYEHYSPEVHLLRNMLDWDIWEDIQPQYEVERDRLRVGYLAAFSYRKGDLRVIDQVIPGLLKRHPEVDFVATSEAMHDALGVPLEQRVTTGEYSFRNPGGHYPVGEKTAVMDIGLVPLEMNALNEGKSHLKGMEYNAAGIPFIASPTESYKDYWCDGSNGVLARTEKEWTDHLEWLVSDDAYRRSMGVFGRLKASEHTYQKKAYLWEDVYKKILGDDCTKLARQSITLGAVQKVSEHAEMLRRVKELQPKVVVELGSARGGTFWTLARVSDPSAMLVSIDLVGGSPIDVDSQGKDRYGGRPERKRIAGFVLEGQTSHMIDASSQEESTVERLKEILSGREIDVLFIDADHRYEGVKRDHELYSPLVRDGGLIFFHDIIVQNDPRARVHVLWNELKEQYDRWEEFIGRDTWGFDQWGAIGVVVK